MLIHLWEYVSGAYSWLHGDLGSATVRCPVEEERQGRKCEDEGEEEGETKERSDMDDLERELKAGLYVM